MNGEFRFEKRDTSPNLAEEMSKIKFLINEIIFLFI